MKKFYATLAAVAFGCAALVAGPHYNKASEFVKGEMNSMQISELMTKKSVKMDSKVLQRKLQTLAAASRADEFPYVSGDYIVMYEEDVEGTPAVGTTTLVQNDDVVTFQKFIFSDFYDFDGQLNWYVEEYEDQTYEFCLITIPGFAQTTVFNIDGQDLGLFLCGVENGKFGVYTDDIDLIVLEDPTIGSLYITTLYEDCGILFGYLTGESSLSYYTPLFLYPEMLPMNCETTSYWYDLEDMTAEPEEDIVPGFAFMADFDEDGADDALIIYNFCGLPEPAIFVVDEANQKVIDAGSPLWEYQGVPFYMYPLTEDGSDIDIEGFVTGDYTIDGDMTMIDIDQVFALYAEDAGVAGLIGPAFVAIEFAIADGSGVADIVAGEIKDNRIFNVMGVQVDENYKGIVISNGKKYIQL